MAKALVLTFFALLIPASVLSADVGSTSYDLLHKWIPWREKIKLIDEVSITERQDVLNTLVTIYNDSSLNFGCPSILYHTVSGLRHFKGSEKALEIVRESLHHREPEVRMIGMEVLGEIGTEEDVIFLKPFLSSKSYFESNCAEIALRNITKRRNSSH